GGQQGLRRNATIIEAIAAHLAGFNEDSRGAKLRRPGRHRQARGAAADHADVRFQQPHHRSRGEARRRRRNFTTIGTAARMASPTSAPLTCGVSRLLRLRSTPVSSTLPNPAPMVVKIAVAGMMPMKVVTMKIGRGTPRKAGMRLAMKNGIAG